MKNLIFIVVVVCNIKCNSQVQLLGMTSVGGAFNSGVLFQYSTGVDTYTNTLDFSGAINGSHPRGSLMKASDGKLYGMTYDGGANGLGTLFQYDLNNNLCTDKFEFDGTTNGSFPSGTLMQAADGNLYGLTGGGGVNNKGVIFKYDIATNIFTKLVDFDGGNSGASPYGVLVQTLNGMLYGLTFGGGTSGNGVLFKYDPVTNALTKKIDFIGPNGTMPNGSLILANDGKLYGTTLVGGSIGNGTIFQFDPVTDIHTVKINFVAPSSNGSGPRGDLLQASDGNLYGMTEYGGANSYGVLFQYNPSTEFYSKKIDFTGATKGSHSYSSLIQASDGNLYGLTTYGGIYDLGVLFQYNFTSNTLTKKYDFNGTNGSSPLFTNLIEISTIVTNIQKNTASNTIIISPNPNNGLFTIDINSKSQITIINVLGETVFDQSLEMGKQELNIQPQINGIYIVKIMDAKGLCFSKKIIVNK